MANRKITVVGDGAEEPLSPEEEHKIEVKIDKMLDPNQPDANPAASDAAVDQLTSEADEIEAAATAAASQLGKGKKDAKAKKPPAEDEAPEPKVTKIITKFADDEPEEAEDLEAQEESVKSAEDAQTAPPLPKKAAKKIKITHDDDEVPTAESEAPASEAEEINAAAEPEAEVVEMEAIEPEEPEVSEEAADPEETSESEAPEPKEPTPIITKFADDEPAEQADEPAATTHTGKTIEPPTKKVTKTEELDPVQASALSAQASMQGSIIPLRKPETAETEEIVDDLTSGSPAADPLSAEDAAIAHAFDTKPSVGAGARLRSALFNRTTLRLVIILIVLTAIAVPLAVPSIRSKLSDKIHNVHSSSKTPAAVQTPKKTVASTPAIIPLEVYVAKQSSSFNVNKADVNGQNPQLILAGTGSEQLATTTVVPNAGSTSTAVVSNRSAASQTLTIIDLASGKSEAVDTSNTIHIMDWFGDHVVYVLSKTNTATGDVNRDQLISYDVKTKQRVVLDHAAYFNDIMSAQGSIYYTTASTTGALQFIKVSPTGTKQVLLNTEVWRIYRTDYNHLVLGTASTWYSYKIGDAKPTTINSAYSGPSRLYVDSPDGKNSVWIDTSGGKSTLMDYDVATGKDTMVAQQTGLSYPVRWLGNSTVAYRANTPTETADYSVSAQGGTGKKILDVVNAGGLSLWY